jgi:hypothetical protein
LLESIKKELSLVILKLHLVDLLFRRWPRVPLPYYWYGYERDFSGHPRAKSGHLRAKSSTLTNNPRDQETQASFSANANKVYGIGHLAMLLIQVSQF